MKKCPSCGKPLDVDWNVCPHCGRLVAGGSSTEQNIRMVGKVTLAVCDASLTQAQTELEKKGDLVHAEQLAIARSFITQFIPILLETISAFTLQRERTRAEPAATDAEQNAERPRTVSSQT